MKTGFKAALIAALLCFSVPAYAVAIITGSDTGGALGHNSSTGSTTVSVTTGGAAAPIGSLIVAMPTQAGAVTWSGCIDSAGNTYSPASSNTNNGINTVREFYTVATANLPIGGTVTCTSNSTSGAKTMVVVAFSGLSGAPLDSATPISGLTGTGTSMPVGPTGTLNYPGGSNGEVLVGVVSAAASSGSLTNDATFVDLGTFGNGGGTQNRSFFGYKLKSSSAADSFTPVGSVSSAYAGNLGAYIGTGGGAAALQGGMLLRGAGR